MAMKSPRNDNAGRNRKIAKFGLAGIAIIGVGAGLTSAAWTDNVWFSAEASAGNVDLEGSANGTVWAQGDTEGTAIIVDPAELANMGPEDVRTFDVYVRNMGSTAIELTGIDFAESFGPLFNGNIADDLTPATVGFVPGTIVPTGGAPVMITIEVTAPDWDDNDQDKVGTLIVNVQAEA